MDIEKITGSMEISHWLAELKPSTVVDCGCYGWRLAQTCAQHGHRLIGIDKNHPSSLPAGVEFAAITERGIEMEADSVDVVVASHVIEHVNDPITFFRDLIRILRPGGVLWIEAPSELSAMPPSSDTPHDHSFQNFWDDPTHVRPWTPSSFYRLSISCHAIPVAISRADAGGIPSVRMACIKPLDAAGALPYAYLSLRDVAPGITNAWAHAWGSNALRVGPVQAAIPQR